MCIRDRSLSLLSLLLVWQPEMHIVCKSPVNWPFKQKSVLHSVTFWLLCYVHCHKWTVSITVDVKCIEINAVNYNEFELQLLKPRTHDKQMLANMCCPRILANKSSSCIQNVGQHIYVVQQCWQFINMFILCWPTCAKLCTAIGLPCKHNGASRQTMH